MVSGKVPLSAQEAGGGVSGGDGRLCPLPTRRPSQAQLGAACPGAASLWHPSKLPGAEVPRCLPPARARGRAVGASATPFVNTGSTRLAWAHWEKVEKPEESSPVSGQGWLT